MRKYGWYADSPAELALNLGTWLMLFGLGAIMGEALGTRTAFYLLVAGGLLGVAGQLSWGGTAEVGR